MLHRFFGNSRERLLLTLLGDEEVPADELRRLKAAIAKAESASREERAGGKGRD